MRILVLGAGATGGYFGGRLVEAGRDVTFLVRAARAKRLRESGLHIRSSLGDAHIDNPNCVSAQELTSTYDLVILSCKAYDLDDAVNAIAPAVGDQTAILPLLNGMQHLDLLDERLGKSKVLGALCVIAATTDKDGTIVHLNNVSSVTFGERDGSRSPRVDAIAHLMKGAKFDTNASNSIVHDMWEKWVFLATLAGSTCLMRASVGDIIAAPSGLRFIESMYAECSAIAAGHGFSPREKAIGQAKGMLTKPGSIFTASMMRDIENHSRIEADHIVGDLLARGRNGDSPVLMQLAYTHLKAYEARRAREAAAVSTA
jgi:2-dehydropantoate 2-reductase